MTELVIGDCHFGTHTNKTMWLNAQIDFFEKQIYNIIETHKLDRIVFLGDIFDIRYSTNTHVGIEVKKIFRKLLSYNLQIIIVAGNHDYYSPLKELDEYNTYDLLFGPEFENAFPNLIILKNKPLLIDTYLFLPWYYTEEEDLWDDACEQYKGKVKIIYCHSDLAQWGHEKLGPMGYPKVYSGHIHYPWENPELRLVNLGACMSYTFNDVNSTRHVFIITDGVVTEKIENTITPRFKRFYNEQLFTITQEDVTNCYIELCIARSKINTARYVEQVRYLKSSLEYFDMKSKAIDDDTELDHLTPVSFNTNIDTYIEDNIPEHLKTKYELVKEKLKTEQ